MRNGISIEELQKELVLRTKLLYELYRRKVFGFNEMSEIINSYYKEPISILTTYGITA